MNARLILGVAAMTMAWPAAAQAADYGGGTAPDSVKRANRQLTLIGDPHGRRRQRAPRREGGSRLRPGEGDPRRSSSPPTALRARAHRSATACASEPGLRQRSRIALSGQIVGAVASGTVSSSAHLPAGRPHGRALRLGRACVGRRAPPRPSPRRPRPRPNGAYHGLTEPDGPAVPARLARRLRRRARAGGRVRVPPALRRRPLRVGEHHARRADRRATGRSACASGSPITWADGTRALPRQGRRALHPERRQRHAVGQLGAALAVGAGARPLPHRAGGVRRAALACTA